MGYLTPETIPADTICRVLFIPNDEQLLANVLGAVRELTFPSNWQPFGAVTPENAAAAMFDMFDLLASNIGACRMIGEIIAYAGTTSPDTDKWLPCDGSSLLRADYPDLFTVIGTTYGSVDGTHFNIPDLQGRSASGAGTGAGLSAVSVGDSYGEENHVLVTAELASHSHTDTGHTHAEGNAAPALGAAIVGVPVPSAIPAVGVTGIGNASITSTGADTGHNTIGPRLGILYLIVALQ